MCGEEVAMGGGWLFEFARVRVYSVWVYGCQLSDVVRVN